MSYFKSDISREMSEIFTEYFICRMTFPTFSIITFFSEKRLQSGQKVARVFSKTHFPSQFCSPIQKLFVGKKMFVHARTHIKRVLCEQKNISEENILRSTTTFGTFSIIGKSVLREKKVFMGVFSTFAAYAWK